jgi:hypothetical protein
MTPTNLRSIIQAATPGPREFHVHDFDGMYWDVRSNGITVFDDGTAGGEYSTQCSKSDRAAIVATMNHADALCECAELLGNVRAWLNDPKQGTWPYVENGGMFEDMHHFKARITAALARLEAIK